MKKNLLLTVVCAFGCFFSVVSNGASLSEDKIYFQITDGRSKFTASMEFLDKNYLKKNKISLQYICAGDSGGLSLEMYGIYDEAGSMSRAGPRYECLYFVRASGRPLQQAVIKTFIPEHFLSKIGETYRPRLFAVVVQRGANGEVIDDVVPLKTEFNTQTRQIIGALPPYVFITDFSQANSSEVQSFILLGSTPK